MIDHIAWTWFPFVATNAVVILLLTVVPREKRTFQTLSFATCVWMWTGWRLAAKYPSSHDWVWVPLLAVAAGVTLYGLVELNRMGKEIKKARSKQ